MDASDSEGEQSVHGVSTSNGPDKPALSTVKDNNSHKERNNNKRGNASLPLSLFFSDTAPTSIRHVLQSRTTVVYSAHGIGGAVTLVQCCGVTVLL